MEKTRAKPMLIRWLVTTLAIGLAIAGLQVSTASASVYDISQLDINATVHSDGRLSIIESIQFSQAGDATAAFSQHLTTVMPEKRNWEFHYQIENVTSLSGQAITLTPDSTGVTLSFSDESTQEAIVISYDVIGAALISPENDTIVTWDLVQGFDNYTISNINAEVNAKAQFTFIDCAAGDAYAPAGCLSYAGGTHANPIPTFHHKNLQPGEVLRATLRFPHDLVKPNQDLRERWSLDRAFTIGVLPLGLSAVILLGGGVALWLIHRRFGKDAKTSELIEVAEFHPTGEGEVEFRVLNTVRPGAVGTVLDEHVDPIDITATLLDLAVRGHLLIRELPRISAHAQTDWALSRRSHPSSLSTYEHTLLEQIAPADGTEVLVSSLSGSVTPIIRQVQAQLYDEVVAHGWFRRNPHTARTKWGRLAAGFLVVALIADILLAIFTQFAIPGLAVVLLAVISIFVAGEMPAKTGVGVSLLNGLDSLRAILATQPVDQFPKGQEIAQISTLLPYAVVLGGADRWLQAMPTFDDKEVADCEEIDWYHAPDTWRLVDLPASLHAFLITVQGTLFLRR